MLIADNETTHDLLNNKAIASTIIKTLTDSDEPLTIGVHGDWGAGKSSVLRMIEEGMCGGEDTVCLHFNGWLFQGFEDAKIVLIETIVHELEKARPGLAKVTEVAKKVLKRLDWLRMAKHAGGLAWTAFAGVPTPEQLTDALSLIKGAIPSSASEVPVASLESAIGQLGEALKGGDSHHVSQEINEFRKGFEELLQAANVKKLVVLIDDLDRCLPATAIDILEALRLFFLMPGAAFVIAADEAMIEYAVRQHFPDISYSERAKSYTRNYLEKLINVPFRLPPLGLSETKIYVTLLLLSTEIALDDERFLKIAQKGKELMKTPWACNGLSRADIEDVLKQKYFDQLEPCLKIGNTIGGLVARGTKGNPRQIKRFINTYLLRMQIADARGLKSYINPEVLAKLMLVEQFLPELYEQILSEVPQKQTGTSLTIQGLESNEADSAEARRLKDKFAEADYLEWGRLSPEIGENDLRPYLFVVQDRSRVEYVGVQANNLERLANELAKSKVSIAQQHKNVKALSEADVVRLCGILRGKVLESTTLKKIPSGLEGLMLVAELHESAKLELLELLKNLPTDDIGAWAARGWQKSLGDQHKEGVRAFLERLIAEGPKEHRVAFDVGLKSLKG